MNLEREIWIEPYSGWQSRAECRIRGIDPDLYFPTKEDPLIDEEAFKACMNCDVQDQCLTHGIIYERHGYFGGVSAGERRRIRQRSSVSKLCAGLCGQRLIMKSSRSIVICDDCQEIVMDRRRENRRPQ